MAIMDNVVREELVEEDVRLPEIPVQSSETIVQDNDIVEDLIVLDEAVTAVESLLNVYDTCKRNVDKGLEPATARLMVISTESICNRLGISIKREIPALEHFSSVHTTSQATRLSLETIGETISAIFSAFIEMLKNLITKIFDFFKNVINEAEQHRTEQYQRVIKQEIERIKKCNGCESDETTYITNQRLIVAFSDPKSGISDETIKAILTNAQDYCDFLIAAAEPVSKYFDEMITELKFFNNELKQQYYSTYVFGEKIDTRVGLFLETVFNPEFEAMFDKLTKSKEEFDSKLIQNCDVANIDGKIHASGILASGVRFAYYLQKSSHTLTCEKTQQLISYDSEDKTVYKLPSLDLVNEVNGMLMTLNSSMAKLSAIVNQKHSHMQKQINQLLTSALAEVKHAEKKVSSDDYTTLYVTVKIAMKLLTDVFTFYKDAYGSGLAVIKDTSDCGNMMTKTIVGQFQQLARNKE